VDDIRPSPGAGGALIKLDHKKPFPLYWYHQETALSTAQIDSARHFPCSGINPRAIAKEKIFLGEKKSATVSACISNLSSVQGRGPFFTAPR